MASACAVNSIGILPDNFLDCPPATLPSYAWLSPSLSFANNHDSSNPQENPDPDTSVADFEFRLDDPVAMLPADELFSDGKLMPLHLSSTLRQETNELTSPETAKATRRIDISGTEASLLSPKAPRCSSRWKEFLGLKKKLYQSANAAAKGDAQKTTSSSSSNPNKSLKHFLHKSSKTMASSSSESASLSQPLLKDSDCESVSFSSRLSLSSSSSSGHDHEDLPRLSLDSDKPAPIPNPNPISLHRNPNPAQPRILLVKPRAGSFDNIQNQRSLMDNPTGIRVGRSPIRRNTGESGGGGSRGVSVDSPRMNSSGKIVFQSLERSSSSPSSFNGGPRFKHRGMVRSYSANVRITPVLNVPVCSLRGSSKSGSVFGFGQFFSNSQKKGVGGNGGSGNKGPHHRHNSVKGRG